RARMADSDPPDEVDDVERPTDWNVIAPDADAFQHQVGDGVEQHQRAQKHDRESEDPTLLEAAHQHDVGDLPGERVEILAWPHERRARIDVCFSLSVYFSHSSLLTAASTGF